MLANTLKNILINNVKSKAFSQPSAFFHFARVNLNETTQNQTNSTGEGEQAQQQAAPSPAEFKQLQDKLAKCENDLIDFKDRYMRSLAETENTRIRLGKQIDDAKIYGIQGFSKDLLEVADILNLAIANTDPKKTQSEGDQRANEQLQAMFNGLVMTEKCLLKIFSKHGLTQILPSEGEKFNPNLHEAIFRIPLPGKPSGSK